MIKITQVQLLKMDEWMCSNARPYDLANGIRKLPPPPPRANAHSKIKKATFFSRATAHREKAETYPSQAPVPPKKHGNISPPSQSFTHIKNIKDFLKIFEKGVDF